MDTRIGDGYREKTKRPIRTKRYNRLGVFKMFFEMMVEILF